MELCPECGAVWQEGQTCQDHFHQMLFWESEYPDYGVVHHLTVLCYHLQHPSLYSPDGLDAGLQLLLDFVERGRSPQEVRRLNRDRVRSDRRAWKVTARPGSHGAYPQPVRWTLTAADVVARGPDGYVDGVREWAAATLQSLRESGSLPPPGAP